MTLLTGLSPFLSPLASYCHSWRQPCNFALSADSWFAVESCIAALASAAPPLYLCQGLVQLPSAGSWFAAVLRTDQTAIRHGSSALCFVLCPVHTLATNSVSVTVAHLLPSASPSPFPFVSVVPAYIFSLFISLPYGSGESLAMGMEITLSVVQ
jgi:hypothetical protein